MVFDVRCLPNPHWVPNLRTLTGLDAPVADFLHSHQEVLDMTADIEGFLDDWLPKFEENSRSYVTVAIGCTGGQHRSVYLSEKLYLSFNSKWDNVQIRHRELGRLNDHKPLRQKLDPT